MNKPLLPETYLPRDIDGLIECWIDSNASCLLVQGPRQVGKSASVGHALEPLVFGDDYGYIDFGNQDIAEAAYASSSSSKTLVQDLLFSIGASLREGAILFLDEIQNALPKNIEDASSQRKWIKNLLESAKGASVRLILTGSFLGLSLSELSAYFAHMDYPIVTVRPLSMHEFSIGKGFFSETEWKEIGEACLFKTHLALPMHRKMMDAFACYLYVGGMPASVLKFDAKTGDLSQSEKELAELCETTKSVLAQYMDVRGREHFFEDMLDLFYRGIKSSDKKAYNKKAFASAEMDPKTLDFIRRSEVGLLFFPPGENDLLQAKIYFSDVGIMHYLAFHGKLPEHEAKDAQAGLDTLRRYYRGESPEKTGNIGYVYEQVVASALVQQQIQASYLKEDNFEIEFLCDGTGLEIKSGDYDSRASLKWYVSHGHVGFVLGQHPFVGKLGSLNYAPIYWVFFLQENRMLFQKDLPPLSKEQKEELMALLQEQGEA